MVKEAEERDDRWSLGLRAGEPAIEWRGAELNGGVGGGGRQWTVEVFERAAVEDDGDSSDGRASCRLYS